MAEASGGNGGGIVQAELDQLASEAQGLGDISQTQASLMHQLGTTLDNLAAMMTGDSVSPALAACGERLIHDGQQFSSKFEEHSDMMTGNRVGLEQMDGDSAHGFNSVQGGIRV